MTQPPEPGTTTEQISHEVAVEAAASIGDDIARHHDLHRQADAKATGGFAVVGLIIAAASTVLPRLSHIHLGLAVLALCSVVFAGVMFGFVLVPRGPQSSHYRSPEQITATAVGSIRDPHFLLHWRAHELANLEQITDVKSRYVHAGFILLGIALLVAIAVCVCGLRSLLPTSVSDCCLAHVRLPEYCASGSSNPVLAGYS